MADYAHGERRVRAAAGGFSPGEAAAMPGKKRRRRPAFDLMLETRRCAELDKWGGKWRIMSAGNEWARWLRGKNLPR